MTTYKNELYHHGIKGQKWGVRRFQNEDGSYTAAGKKRYGVDSSGNMSAKGSKKWYKDNKVQMINRRIQLDKEFDKTDSGKSLKKEYERQIRKMETSDDWTEKDDRNFSKAEETYLRRQAEYSARRLIQEYGQQKAAIYANRGRTDIGKDAVQALSDNWWIHAI